MTGSFRVGILVDAFQFRTLQMLLGQVWISNMT